MLYAAEARTSQASSQFARLGLQVLSAPEQQPQLPLWCTAGQPRHQLHHQQQGLAGPLLQHLGQQQQQVQESQQATPPQAPLLPHQSPPRVSQPQPTDEARMEAVLAALPTLGTPHIIALVRQGLLLSSNLSIACGLRL